jgi:ABC-type transport system involved in multi-copper enzyme maturation permease subunit
MLSLIIKDIMIQKKSVAYSLFFGFIMIIAFQGQQGNGAYIIGALAIVFLLTSGVFAYDERNKGDILINSLPVSRKDVVTARYLSLLVFSIAAVIIVSLVGAAINISGIPHELSYISIPDIAAIFLVSSIMFSIYIPIYFKFGYLKSRMANIILYIAVLSVSSVVGAVRKMVFENLDDPSVRSILSILGSIPDWLVGPIFIVFILLAVYISFSISIRVYGRREF